MVRLDRFLADALNATRSQVKEYIRSGRVSVDEAVIRDPSGKIDPEKRRICVDGQPISGNRPGFLMMNKPAGYVTAATDARYPVVMDLVDPSMRGRKGVFAVGRLDLDTEGLLLFTGDGEKAHHLLSPARHIPKTYQAVLKGQVGEEQIHAFSEGLDIGDEKKTLPAQVEVLQQMQEVCFVEITVTEGRYHQIKRMAEAVGCPVIYLRRVRMGGLWLDLTLKKGEVRPLTPQEEALIG